LNSSIVVIQLDLKKNNRHNLLVSYKTEKRIIAVLLILFFIICLVLPENKSNLKEFYPFFAWDLFDYVPNTGMKYELFVLSYDGQKFDPPLSFNESLLISKRRTGFTTQYFNIIQDLGRSAESRNKETFEKNRKKIEELFLPSEYGYEIKFVTYDPLEYLKTKKYKAERSIIFVKGPEK
jgi:hypothetical protein